MKETEIMGRVNKRSITVNGISYIWTLKGNRIDTEEHHIKVHKEGVNNFILFIDPYDWNFEIRPEYIRKAIIFALNNDWGQNLNKKDSTFILLPEGIKFKHEIK